MKAIRPTLFFLLVAACVALGIIIPNAIDRLTARGPVVMQKPTVQSILLTALRDKAGNLTALHAVGTYHVQSLNPDGVTWTEHLCTIDIDLVQNAKVTIGVNNEVVNFGDQMDEILTLADAIWFHRFPPRLAMPRESERKKALREKGADTQPNLRR